MDSNDTWWRDLPADAAAGLAATWIPVGLPGFAGDAKHRRTEVLDERFGPDGWRQAHVVRGRVVGFDEAIAEYEEAYRVFLRDRPELVRFLVEACGNVYDDRVENVHDTAYAQPHTVQNHYQDISVRRVIAELVDDPSWSWVTDTPGGEADLLDAGTGAIHRVPRARGFRGGLLLQIRDPRSPGYVLNPAVVPVHDPALVNKFRSGELVESGCDNCNGCVAYIYHPAGTRCVRNPPNDLAANRIPASAGAGT